MGTIEVKNAAFAYNEKNIFSDISFSINPGEILCLIGPNGCGKTTLLDCILGIKNLKKGEVILNGNDIRMMKPHEVAKEISYVPQSHEMTFPYKVLEIVLMGRAAYTSIFSSPSQRDMSIAEGALDMVGMLGFKDRIYTHLSGGEAQMVMIARALAQESPFIILDEPTSHLDIKHEHRILENIVELMGEKKLGIIMATHFPNHAFHMENSGIKTSVAMFHNRKLKEIGPPSKVLCKQNMYKVFNIETKLLCYEDDKYQKSSYIVPLFTRRKVEECQDYKTEKTS
ncbi:MAG: ABC transporter ATP-binding protein [Maledivibacter sp.]|jgi:iron complex transport system ATP-binding protein|nr:ABC transporter ATP-binding protein [Maledivibacter sp.]